MVMQYNSFVVLGSERMVCDYLLLVYALPVQGIREDNGECAGDVYGDGLGQENRVGMGHEDRSGGKHEQTEQVRFIDILFMSSNIATHSKCSTYVLVFTNISEFQGNAKYNKIIVLRYYGRSAEYRCRGDGVSPTVSCSSGSRGSWGSRDARYLRWAEPSRGRRSTTISCLSTSPS